MGLLVTFLLGSNQSAGRFRIRAEAVRLRLAILDHEHEQDDAADDRNERQEQPPAAAVRVVQSTDSDRR